MNIICFILSHIHFAHNWIGLVWLNVIWHHHLPFTIPYNVYDSFCCETVNSSFRILFMVRNFWEFGLEQTLSTRALVIDKHSQNKKPKRIRCSLNQNRKWNEIQKLWQVKGGIKCPHLFRKKRIKTNLYLHQGHCSDPCHFNAMTFSASPRKLWPWLR